jgi:hypothetical protein
MKWLRRHLDEGLPMLKNFEKVVANLQRRQP